MAPDSEDPLHNNWVNIVHNRHGQGETLFLPCTTPCELPTGALSCACLPTLHLEPAGRQCANAHLLPVYCRALVSILP